MTYTVPPTTPQRPATVSLATYLLYLLAVLQAVGVVITLATLPALRTATEQAYQGTVVADSGATIATVGAVVGCVVALFLAIGFPVLGILDSKGKNPARIVTWVLSGLGFCCLGINTVSTAMAGSFNLGAPRGTNAPDPAEVTRTIRDALPSWHYPATLALDVLSLLALLGVAILLALPASHAFFRKQPPQLGEPSYPAYPSYPPPPSA